MKNMNFVLLNVKRIIPKCELGVTVKAVKKGQDLVNLIFIWPLVNSVLLFLS